MTTIGPTTRVIAARRWLGLLAAASGLLALAGYVTDISALWRPIAQGPATHPYTAICLILAGVGCCLRGNAPSRAIGNALVLLAAVVGGLRLAETISGTGLVDANVLFRGLLTREAGRGRPVMMGWNSALVFVLAGLCCLTGRAPRLSQLLGALALIPPLVAVVGYSYGLKDFYGEMSLVTMVGALCLGCSSLLLTAPHAFLAMPFAPGLGGTIARVMIPALSGFEFVVGLAAVRSGSAINANAFAVQIALLIVVSAIAILAVSYAIDKAMGRGID